MRKPVNKDIVNRKTVIKNSENKRKSEDTKMESRKGEESRERGMNDRIRRLRKQSVETQAHIDMERARLFTEVYRQYEGTVSVPELRAMCLKHYFTHKTLCINPGELIVGEKGDGPQAAPTFPELCCHTVQDLHITY